MDESFVHQGPVGLQSVPFAQSRVKGKEFSPRQFSHHNMVILYHILLDVCRRVEQ